MYLCPQCSGPLHRTRRTWLERLTSTAAFYCDSCDKRIIAPRIDRGPYANCPKCGSVNLSILRSPDFVDEMDLNPFRNMRRLFGARLYHCWRCRLQFYDLRARHPKQRDSSSEARIAQSA